VNFPLFLITLAGFFLFYSSAQIPLKRVIFLRLPFSQERKARAPSLCPIPTHLFTFLHPFPEASLLLFVFFSSMRTLSSDVVLFSRDRACTYLWFNFSPDFPKDINPEDFLPRLVWVFLRLRLRQAYRSFQCHQNLQLQSVGVHRNSQRPSMLPGATTQLRSYSSPLLPSTHNLHKSVPARFQGHYRDSCGLFLEAATFFSITPLRQLRRLGKRRLEDFVILRPPGSATAGPILPTLPSISHQHHQDVTDMAFSSAHGMAYWSDPALGRTQLFLRILGSPTPLFSFSTSEFSLPISRLGKRIFSMDLFSDIIFPSGHVI